MKHNIKIIAVLLAMFLVTQFIGLYVVHYYSDQDNKLPFGLETPKIEKETDYYNVFTQIIIAFVIAVALLFLLNKFNYAVILKIWFFGVVVIALSISINSLFGRFGYSVWIAALIALPLAFVKVFKRNFLIHNSTELLIYPGIAAVFVPILNVGTIILLLVFISIYDAWAVWKSGIMQKMAKYQIEKLNIFGGFFIPYMSKKTRLNLKKFEENKVKNKKVKVSLAILGGGDVIFPIIASGVMLVRFGVIPALLVTLGATLGLCYLFIFSKKEKFYPAMPFISTGIFLGMIVAYLIQ